LFIFSFIAVGFSQLSRFDVVQWASAPFVSIPHFIYQGRNSYRCLINGAEAPDSPYYPFNSQLKLTAMNSPSFECQPVIRIRKQIVDYIPTAAVTFLCFFVWVVAKESKWNELELFVKKITVQMLF
jgi:hypothetical protein